MENKDVKFNEIKKVDDSKVLFDEFAEKLQEYTSIGSDGKLAIEIDDPKALAIWKKHLKPLSDALKPLQDEMIALDQRRAEMEVEVRAHFEKMDEVKNKMEALVLKKNKFATRISPMIIREYGSKLNKYQQFGSIIQDGGRVFVTIQDKLASFVNGFNKLAEKHEERVGKKISPKMMAEE